MQTTPVWLLLASTASLTLMSAQGAIPDPCLKLLFVLQRHGDRAPLHSYPTDPHHLYTYPPEGKGNLNTAGKRRAYELGRYLRGAYDRFLGDGLPPGRAALRSSEVPRALESGQLCVAGMFPPEEGERWSSGKEILGSIWSPVSFKTLPMESDNMLRATSSCPALELDKPAAERHARSELSKLNTTVNYIVKHSGVDPNDTKALERVIDTLIAQESCGLRLPEWSDRVYPEPMKRIIGTVMGMDVFTERQKRLTAGVFLHEIVNKTLSFHLGQLPSERRLHLYSAHDTTLLPALAALGVWDGYVPPYSSAIIFEVHQCAETDQPSLKVLYRNDSTSDAQHMILPGCDPVCPLGRFMNLYKDYILTSEQQRKECKGV